MSYISKKKRSANYVAPTIFLVAGMTTVAGTVSADTETGLDTNGSNSANIADVSGTLSSATSDVTSAANSKAASNTSAAPSVSSSTTAGWIDVHVDHTELDDAIRNATAQGVNIIRDPSVVLEGDSVQTASHASSAGSYYTSKAAEIKSVAAQYTNDMANYNAKGGQKPVTPSLNYNLFDIHSKPTSSSGWDNKDGKTIINNPNKNAGGNKVAQAVVNQTVGVNTDNQPLPAERFDKIHDLTISTKLPDDVEFDKALTNSNPDDWTVTYDEDRHTVTQTATAKYLVQINLNNNNGGEWKYDAPQVFFKLLKDDKTYQATSTTIVNHEYMVVGEGVQIRTDSANPTEVNTNRQYQNIDGKVVLPGSINNYVLGWDFDQYNGVNIDSESQQKGLYLVDDYPEDAVSLTGPISIVDPATGGVLYTAAIPDGVTVGSTGEFNDAGGKAVDGFTWKVIDNDSAPENLKGKLNGQALIISYTGTDNDFYKKYVEGGHSLNVVIPMTALAIDKTPDKDVHSYNGNSYANVAWQSDFGNEYKSNEVTNTVPKLDPNKDAVLDFANLGSLDINNNPSASIENSTYFKYRLSGSKLPSNLSEDVKSYKLVDKMDTNSDSYDGTFIVQTGSVISFKAGSLLAQRYPNGVPAGSDISKYFTQTITRDSSGNGQNSNSDKKITGIEINADTDFLAQIDYSKTNFQVDAFLTTKRIANNKEVTNTFQETINGIDYGTNKTVTNTRKNALDELTDKMNSLSSKTSDNTSAISSMANGLSDIVRNITEFESNATSTAKSYFDSNSAAISSVVSNANSTANSIANSASSAIASNSAAISSVASDTNSTVDSIANSASSAIASHSAAISSLVSDVNSTANSIANSASSAIASNSAAISSVASDTKSQVSSAMSSVNARIRSLAHALNAKTKQALSTTTIFDRSIKTEADALAYAVNHGVAPRSITSIEKNAAGRFVVKFNTSKTGINNSKPITVGKSSSPIKKLVKTRAKSVKFNFYLLKSKEDAYKKVESMGYARSAVTSISEKNGVYTVVVNKITI